MWSEVVTTTAAAAEPLLLDDAKAHLRVDGSAADDEITDMISAARGLVEAITGTRLYTQTVALRTDCWDDLASLPVAPVQSITSITYTDTDGTSQTLATTVYEARLYGLSPQIVLKYNQSWPAIRTGSLIVIVAVVGYGVADTQPPETIHAIKMVLSDMYAFRETAQIGSVAGKIPSYATVDALLSNHRRWLI